MQEWIYAAQKLIEYIENHICEKPSLSDISEHIGYSPCYCSEQFHRFAGMTIREYVFRRRLAMTVVDLRDTDISIIDIALRTDFQTSQPLHGLLSMLTDAHLRNTEKIPNRFHLPVRKCFLNLS